MAELNENTYGKSIKISKEEIEAMNLAKDKFHGEWNYIINSKNILKK